MKRLVLKNQDGSLFRRQAVLDERHIYILLAAVKFVADDGMADVRKMDADLVFATGMRAQAQKRKAHLTPALSPRPTGGEGELFAGPLHNWPGKTPLDEKFRLRQRAVGPDAILDGDDAAFVLAERRVNRPLPCRDMAVDDGEIFFLNGAAFKDLPEFAGGFGIFCDQNHAAGFAVEAVDQGRSKAEGRRRKAGNRRIVTFGGCG